MDLVTYQITQIPGQKAAGFAQYDSIVNTVTAIPFFDDALLKGHLRLSLHMHRLP